MVPNFPLSHNEDKIKQAKEARESYHGSGSCHFKLFQLYNYHVKWNHNMDQSNGGYNDLNLNSFVKGVQKRENIWMC